MARIQLPGFPATLKRLPLVPLLSYGAITGLLVGLVIESVEWAVASAMVASLVDVHCSRLRRVRRLRITRRMPPIDQRSLMRQGLFAAFVANTIQVETALPVTVALAGSFLALHIGRMLYFWCMVLAERSMKRTPMWQNIDAVGRTRGPGSSDEPVRRTIRIPGTAAILSTDLFVFASVAVARLTGMPFYIVVGSTVTIVIVAGLVISGAVFAGLWRRWSSSGARTRIDLKSALEALQPEAITHFGGSASNGGALRTWLPVLEHITVPQLLILRDARNLKLVSSSNLPTVVLHRDVDVEEFCTPSVKVALHPVHGPKNNHLIRIPGILQCYLGSGISSERLLVNAAVRIYDEIWLAGPEEGNGYLRLNDGVRSDQLHIVGRPQLAPLREFHKRNDPPVAAYLPDWDGLSSVENRSSLQQAARLILSGLRAAGCEVVVILHPTAERPSFGTVRALMRRFDTDESISFAGGTDRVEQLARADVMVVDSHSEFIDLLASNCPIITTEISHEGAPGPVQANPVLSATTRLPVRTSRTEVTNPVTGAVTMETTVQVPEFGPILAEVLDSDPRAVERAVLAHAWRPLVGDGTAASFAAQVDSAILRSREISTRVKVPQ